ncbi:hypothetical protein CFBP4996_26200 (plasmid) [Agrobacterium leguminum]|uniref:hypothetical protein n=1 Tax=Agrobacterium leguminum TaxID=2792015 RepID=UPI0010C942ED|nr:hypothetical protein [Agrobacterium leguminum]WFS69567.1 hypothetical protein CFBP4996_26200 [Agrobacterium leguminum]
MLIGGLLIVGAWIWSAVQFNRRHKALDRVRFERTNSSGILEFATYDEKLSFDRREGWNKLFMILLIVPGGPIFLFGILMVAGGLFR